MTYRTAVHVPGRVGARQVDVCCQAFANAMQTGTDNEGYGALIDLVDSDAPCTWVMGVGLPQPFHCPWCGADPNVTPVTT